MKPLILALAIMTTQLAFAESKPTVYDIPLQTLAGKDATLKPYKGKVVLIVNVASQCGLTPQYKALEQIHEKYHDKGFAVLGFPCNDFNSQEPGTADEIQKFCTSNYGVTFPLFAKLHVKGPDQHPLYVVLTGKDAPFPGDVKWNFGKFLIGKDGQILHRFEPRTTPEDPEVVKAIEAALAAKP